MKAERRVQRLLTLRHMYAEEIYGAAASSSTRQTSALRPFVMKLLEDAQPARDGIPSSVETYDQLLEEFHERVRNRQFDKGDTPSGLKWRKTTGTPPTQSIELTIEGLREALMGDKLEFTQAEWNGFGARRFSLSRWHVVRVDGAYFHPADAHITNTLYVTLKYINNIEHCLRILTLAALGVTDASVNRGAVAKTMTDANGCRARFRQQWKTVLDSQLVVCAWMNAWKDTSYVSASLHDEGMWESMIALIMLQPFSSKTFKLF